MGSGQGTWQTGRPLEIIAAYALELEICSAIMYQCGMECRMAHRLVAKLFALLSYGLA